MNETSTPVENRGYCISCKKQVPVRKEARDERVYLIKSCDKCGETETLLSTDAALYKKKVAVDGNYDYRGCSFDCLSCKHPKDPKIVFVDVTNRCNLNCPICIVNSSSMGFRFNPPLEYFEKIFEHFGGLSPPPSIHLFGGEPTVREDLIHIIELAHSYEIPTNVVTNGLRLANERYCRELLSTGTNLVFSYDGANEGTYKKFRNNSSVLSLKLEALDNIRKWTQAKIAILYVVAKGINDMELDSLFHFLHDRSDFISGINFITITPTWAPGRFPEIEADRTTMEDVENLVDNVFPAEKVEFVPVGVLDNSFIMNYTNINPNPLVGIHPIYNPLVGAHPNCESVGFLVSDGKSFVPISAYLKKSMFEIAKEIKDKGWSLTKMLASINNNRIGDILELMGLKRTLNKIIISTFFANTLFGNARIGKIVDANGINGAAKVLKALVQICLGHEVKEVLRKHTAIRRVLRMTVFPFEDDAILESERLERCMAAFAYFDPETNKVKTIPGCAWGHYKERVLGKVAERFGCSP